MNKKIVNLLILVASCFTISCDFKLLDSDPYHIIEWACIMNSDGSELEYLYEIGDEGVYFPNGAKFTQDSQKIIFGSTEGLFTRDFAGNVERISNLKRSEYNFYSSDLEYMYHLENNDIYRMNFDGTDKINITNTPDEVETEANLSNDNQYITYVVELDTLYKLCKIDINGDNLQEVYESILQISYPKYNDIDDKIYFMNFNDLLSINIYNNQITTLEEHGVLSNGFQISLDEKIIVYPRTNRELILLNLISGELCIITESYDASGKFSLNYDGDKIIIGGFTTGVAMRIKDIELGTMQELGDGINPFISPDGEKIFFTKGVSASENIE